MPPSAVTESTPYQFANALWSGGEPPEDLVVAVSDKTFSRTPVFSNLPSLAAAVLMTALVYMSLAAHAHPAVGRGDAMSARAIPALLVEIDIKGGKHKETNLPTLEEALGLVADLPLPPTIISHSGGGL